MSYILINKNNEEFQNAVKKLGSDVNKAATLWNDEKFSELSAAISEVANMSRDVIVAGDRCCNSIDKFEKIASEKY